MTEVKKTSVFFWLFVIVFGAVLIASLITLGFMWYMQRQPKMGGDFNLTYRGHPWAFSDDAKKLNILYIGYAKCPDVCPMTLSVASQAFNQLSTKELQNVRLLFLSVDFKNDKPEDVADYATEFFPHFIGLSGSEEQIDKTVFQYGANYFVEKDPKSYLGYSITHADRLYFLDSKGMVLGTIVNPRSAENILQAIKENL